MPQPLVTIKPLIINPFTKSEASVKKTAWRLGNENPKHDLCSEPVAGLMLLAVNAGSCLMGPWATASSDTRASICPAPFIHTCLQFSLSLSLYPLLPISSSCLSPTMGCYLCQRAPWLHFTLMLFGAEGHQFSNSQGKNTASSSDNNRNGFTGTLDPCFLINH